MPRLLAAALALTTGWAVAAEIRPISDQATYEMLNGVSAAIAPKANKISKSTPARPVAAARPAKPAAAEPRTPVAPPNFIDVAMNSVVEVMVVQPKDKTSPEELDAMVQQGTPLEKLPKYFQKAHGTGFIYREDGRIFTNAHVLKAKEVGEDPVILIKFSGDRLYMKPKEFDFTAKVLAVGEGGKKDIAILQIQAPLHQGVKWSALTLGSTKNHRRGDSVWALGFPLEAPSSVSHGIISALDFEGSHVNYVQTDAAVNPGNSGGPMIDQQGRVLGMNTWGMTTNGGNSGVNYAVSVEDLIRADKQFDRVGNIDTGYAELGTVIEGDHVKIAELKKESPAGFEQGDVLVAVNGKNLPGDGDLAMMDLNEAIKIHAPGETIGITVLRKGGQKTVTVTLGKEPPAPIRDDEEDGAGGAPPVVGDPADGPFGQLPPAAHGPQHTPANGSTPGAGLPATTKPGDGCPTDEELSAGWVEYKSDVDVGFPQQPWDDHLQTWSVLGKPHSIQVTYDNVDTYWAAVVQRSNETQKSLTNNPNCFAMGSVVFFYGGKGDAPPGDIAAIVKAGAEAKLSHTIIEMRWFDKSTRRKTRWFNRPLAIEQGLTTDAQGQPTSPEVPLPAGINMLNE